MQTTDYKSATHSDTVTDRRHFLLACLFAMNAWYCTRRDGAIAIGVNQFVYHPNLELLYAGLTEVVDKWAVTTGRSVSYDRQVAGAETAVAVQIARAFETADVDLIVALATPSAQASARISTTRPIVFGAITDPVAAGLVDSLQRPNGNVTGTSDLGPYDEQLEMIRALMPMAKRVGVIRNPGEANSVASMRIIDPAIVRWGFTKVEVAVSTPNEVVSAARSLVGRCDVVYLPADNTVLSAITAVVGICEDHKIPLFVGDEGSVKLGAVATIGIDYTKLGYDTGRICIRVLEGEPAGSIPVEVANETRLLINPEAAKRQGLALQADLLSSAEIVNQ